MPKKPRSIARSFSKLRRKMRRLQRKRRRRKLKSPLLRRHRSSRVTQGAKQDEVRTRHTKRLRSRRRQASSASRKERGRDKRKDSRLCKAKRPHKSKR